MRILFLLAAWLPFFALQAQQAGGNIVGIIIDGETKEALIGVNVQLRRMQDTTSLLKGAVSDIEGRFSFAAVAADTYQLKISYLGYDAVMVNNLQLQANATYPLDTVRMRTASAMIDIIEVEALAIRVEMKGDTVQYNSAAFKVNPDATVEDLVKKMPNITVENGVVKAQGEEVKKVTIDGKEFFGDDASTALRNLPADIVDKIQVYDRSSDQAGFLGVRDGNERKALNIVTRTGRLTGNFGRFYAGYGYGDGHRYQAGGNFNNFDGDRRLSILGMSNNINQQNFGSEDLLGVMSAGGGGGGRGGGGGGWGMPTSAVLEGAMSGQQRGITNSHALGINYNDKWGKNTTVSLSYFGNYSQNSNLSDLSRFYFSQSDATTNQLYDETTQSSNNNLSHRINARFEFKPDTMQTFILSPRVSWQQNKQNQDFYGFSQLSDLSFLSSTQTLSAGSGNAYTLSGSATYMRRLKKPRRSISVELSGNLNNRLSRRLQLADNLFAENIDSATLLNQFSRNYNNSYNATLDLTYSEPVGKNGNLQFSLIETYTQSLADKDTDNFSAVSNDYTDKDSTLSSELQSSYLTTRPSIRYRGSAKENAISYFVSLAYENAQLRGFQSFPMDTSLSRSFHNVLPMGMLRVQFSKSSNLRMFYRTFTSAPTANQLQNVVDNSNPLFLSAGNPDLQQSYSQFLMARLTLVNPKNARSFFASLSFNQTSRYIGNSTLIVQRDTVLSSSGIVLNKGAQLSQSVNLGGFYSIASVVSYSMPIQKIKSNINFNFTPLVNQIPSLINGETNLTQNLALGGGFVWGSNISEQVDFTLSYHGNYNFANNRLRPTLNNQYFNQVSALRFNWLFGKGFVLNVSAAHSLYTGMSDGFNQQFLLLNGSFGYKFLKDKSAEINISVFDALGQNAAIVRNVNDIYVEDLSSQVLTRYFMLNFVYTLRAVNAPAGKDGERPHGMPPHGGGHGGHGGHGGGHRPPH